MQWKIASSFAVVIGALSTPLAAQSDVFVFTITSAVAPADTFAFADWPAKRAQLQRMLDRDIQTLQFDGTSPQGSVRQATITFGPAGFVLQLAPVRGNILLRPMDAPKNGNCKQGQRLRES